MTLKEYPEPSRNQRLLRYQRQLHHDSGTRTPTILMSPNAPSGHTLRCEDAETPSRELDLRT